MSDGASDLARVLHDAWDWWSPQARDYQLLQSLDLGPSRKRAGLRLWKGQLIFNEFLRPGDNSRRMRSRCHCCRRG
jgi:hypothetical protein